jgi:hypothetical protein
MQKRTLLSSCHLVAIILKKIMKTRLIVCTVLRTLTFAVSALLSTNNVRLLVRSSIFSFFLLPFLLQIISPLTVYV